MKQRASNVGSISEKPLGFVVSLAEKHSLVLSLAATAWIGEREGRHGLCSRDFPMWLHVMGMTQRDVTAWVRGRAGKGFQDPGRDLHG